MDTDKKMHNSEGMEKVLNGLECCSSRICYDGGCPYHNQSPDYGIDDCTSNLASDALAIIRAQAERIRELEAKKTPRVMTLEEAIEAVQKEGGFVWIEEKSNPLCSPHIRPTNSIFDCPVRKFRDYGKEFVPKRNTLRNMWRCWTSWPTDEQREAVKWDADAAD